MVKKYFKLLLALLGIAFLAFLYFRYDPINNLLFPKCPLYVTTGVYCPGCGSQRATHALLHFDIPAVFKSNILFLPTLLLLGYHAATKITNHFINTKYTSILDRPKAPIIVLGIVIIYWILRNLPYDFFDFLRP